MCDGAGSEMSLRCPRDKPQENKKTWSDDRQEDLTGWRRGQRHPRSNMSVSHTYLFGVLLDQHAGLAARLSGRVQLPGGLREIRSQMRGGLARSWRHRENSRVSRQEEDASNQRKEAHVAASRARWW
jgi:hypothetical protein